MSITAIVIIVLALGSIVGGLLLLKQYSGKFHLSKEQLEKVKQRKEAQEAKDTKDE